MKSIIIVPHRPSIPITIRGGASCSSKTCSSNMYWLPWTTQLHMMKMKPSEGLWSDAPVASAFSGSRKLEREATIWKTDGGYHDG